MNNDLKAYVDSPDSSYRWESLSTTRLKHGSLHDLRLVSQTWQGIEWQHRVHVYLPDRVISTDWGLLSIGHDHLDQPGQTELDLDLTARAGILCIHLYDIPNQPLFEGMREDELLAFTLSQRLDTADATWPLLFPMVKAAMRTLDCAGAFCKEIGAAAPERFIVHGASKRGWTAWLLASVDRRAGAIMPEVYDNLNLAAQMPHQVKMWHGYSEMIEDYTELHLQDKMRTPRGHELAASVDPYTFRAELAIPKLLIHGLSDRYWATDALNLYWDDLPGDKHVVYAPNQGHHISDRSAVLPTQSAFVRAIVEDTCLPEISAEYTETESELCLAVQSSAPGLEARIWTAASETQDFRASEWVSQPLLPSGNRLRFTGAVQRPDSGYLAVVADVRFPHEELPYIQSTQVRILEGRTS
jgi:PhoPQ-activated pathogenicity-related protein